MMKRRCALLSLALAFMLAGCSQPMDDIPEPISIADWQSMPADQKYTQEMLERLKVGNPKLQTPEGWEAFSRSTVTVARKKDFPRTRR
jgi:uncharacterized lipoprotein YbaY